MSDVIDVRKITLAWLDDSPDTSEDISDVEVYLLKIDEKFKRLKNQTECNEYIQTQPDDACISLITNGRLGQEIVPTIHSSSKIVNIYVYCLDKAKHEGWAGNYNKVKGVFTDFNQLKEKLPPPRISRRQTIIKSIEPEQPTSDLQKSTDPAQPAVTEIPVTYGLDGIFLIGNSCFDYLARIRTYPNEKDEFVSLCQESLQGNEDLLSLIQQFKNTYSADQAIHWLYRHHFFHGFLENIFKIAYVDAMLPCRIMIRDVHKQLVQHKCTSKIQVYRSEIMPDEQIQRLRNSVEKIIAIKSFLFTNSVRATALACTDGCSLSNGYKRILLTIEANPQTENVKPFARIGSLGYENDPDDVLFMIASLFRVTAVEDEQDGVINIKLTLCGKDETSQSIEECSKLALKYIAENGETDLIGFAGFLGEFGTSLNAINLCESGGKILQSCLEKLVENDSDRLRCCDGLGAIEFVKENLDSSLEWYKKSFDLRKEKYPENLAEGHQNLATIYLQKQDYPQALETYQQLSSILKQTNGDDCLALISCYSSIAMIHERQENLKEALSCYYLILSILAKLDYSNDQTYATLYLKLGNICAPLARYQLALGYYNQSLEIRLKPDSHTDPTRVAAIYENIASVHESMNNIQQARTNLEKAVEIYRQLDPQDASRVTEIDERIRNLPPIEHSTN